MDFRTDIVYGTNSGHDGNRNLLDVLIPDGTGPFPVVVGIHGGGWSGGDKEGQHLYGEWLAEMGTASVMPNYRLTGSDPHPAQQNDVLDAMNFMAAHAEEWSLDLSRVGLTGVSAGGHLTAQLGLLTTTRNDLPYKVICMYPICPPTDMTKFVLDSPGIRETIEALVGGVAEDHAEAMKDVSPMTHVHADAPPCLIAHGRDDTLVPCSQTTILVDALRAVGAEADAILVPDCDHTGHMPDIEPPEPLGGMEAFKGFFQKHMLDV
jgi:acetyl esterase/lipase